MGHGTPVRDHRQRQRHRERRQLWATETMNNPKYPLELFLRVITVSLETMKIVDGLPKLDT